MSHLAHVLDVKKELTEAGVLCPFEQSSLLNEAYIRAGCSMVFNAGGNLSEENDKKLWKQLDKWNRVSPIAAPLIHQTVLTRVNLVLGTMGSTGSLPCTKKFTSISESGVDVADMPSFPVLVAYVIKELDSGNE